MMGNTDTKIKKATFTVHWPNGPVNCCEEHSEALINLGRFLGAHVVSTQYDGDDDCINCVNTKKKEK
jgi:hypothetical protein